MATTVSVGSTGNQDIDGLLYGLKWSGTLTYSFPDSTGDYAGGGYGDGELSSGFAQVSAAQQQAVHTILAQVANFTNLTIQYAGTNSADLRIAQSTAANPTAYAYLPGSNEGGDVWFGTYYDYRSPTLGDYYHLTHIHELGHALGLKHSQERGGVANVAVPTAHDALEYTVMSYRSYVGGPTTGYTNGSYSYPTTFMMNDIRALQEMYGADFTTNGSDTVYTWSATTGEFSIDGMGQGRPGGPGAGSSANKVFMTVWDGGGSDTYDFSNYATGVAVNLNPGAYSITSSAQLASLGSGNYAHGNVYNAYLYNGDARSYIENAIGGSGADALIGNAAGNRLDGRSGSDTLTGGGGDDLFVFAPGYGNDVITDFIAGISLVDEIDLTAFTSINQFGQILSFGAQVGANAVFSFALGTTLTLQNVLMNSLSIADFVFNVGPNEAPTDIMLADTSVAENAAGGTVGAITVSDPNGELAFTFATSDARFVVAGGPGAYLLKLASGVALDYESESSIDVTVTATDAGGLSVQDTFTITVTDVTGATIVGTSRNDVINGVSSPVGQPKATGDADVISAMAGNDSVRGLGGGDIIDGGAGNDSLYGDGGDDTLTGGLGVDILDGGEGDDTLVLSGTGDATDTLAGGLGNDKVLVAGLGVLTLAGFNSAARSIEGWAGNGAGVLGTKAANAFDFSSLTQVSNLGPVDGAAGNDVITGTGLADDLRGGAGNDTLNGGGGNDILTGGAGVDTLNGGDGDDRFLASGADAATDVIAGGSGTDTFQVAGAASLSLGRFNAALSSIEAWAGNGAGVLGTKAADSFDFSGLQALSGIAFVDGAKGNDVIVGTLFADDLRGGVGNDRLTGGQGNDLLSGGAGNDTFVFAAGFGNDVILDFAAGTKLVDRIELVGLFADYASVLAASQQLGADTLITVTADDTITLKNVALAGLNSNDFLFV